MGCGQSKPVKTPKPESPKAAVEEPKTVYVVTNGHPVNLVQVHRDDIGSIARDPYSPEPVILNINKPVIEPFSPRWQNQPTQPVNQNSYPYYNNQNNNGYNYPAPNANIYQPPTVDDQKKVDIMGGFRGQVPLQEIDYERQASDLELEIKTHFNEVKRLGKVKNFKIISLLT